jgi:imidazole glycerol-phosphate synthase subunit HisF
LGNIRIIPRLDIKGANVVKGVHLEGVRVVGDPEILASKYYEEGADELIYMNVIASLYGCENLVDIIEKASQHIFIPLTVGGGINSLENINNMLRAGADKVAINSWALQYPGFIEQAAKAFGSQCIVGSIEAKRREDNRWEALYNNGRELSGKDAVWWAQELVELGAGELLVTSVDREGTRKGYDITLIERISTLVKVPVVASGGAGSLDDIKDVIYKGKADAVSVAGLLHYDNLSIGEIKGFLEPD